MGQHSCPSIDVDVVPQIVGQHRENTNFCLSSHANHHANLRIRILGSFHGWKEPNTMRSNADYQSRPSWSLPPGMASSRSRVYCFCGWSKTSYGGRTCSTSLTVLHHHNLVGDLTNHGQIVGDEQVAQALSACRSLSRRNTWSCTSTSKADTASSHTMTSGSRAMARAMAMRWRWPPESSFG